MNRGVKAGIATTVVALFAAGGYGAYNFVHAIGGVGGVAGPAATAVSSTPPSGADALKRAQAFLDSWQQGPSHYDGAASATNDPADAGVALKSYHDGLGLTSVTFSGLTPVVGSGTTTKVSFTVKAVVTGGTWTYSSSLDVLRSVGGLTSVEWSPTVLYPKLQDGQTLKAGAISVPDGNVTVVDRHGVPLTSDAFPSLTDVVAQLKGSFASQATGSGKGGRGTGVDLVDATGAHVGNATVFKAPVGPKLYTTLDAKIQAQAELAVKDSHIAGKSVGVVAIDHASGGIRAIAYRGEDGDIAINGRTAPGSTMKIVTAATLIDKGGMSTGSPAVCSPTLTVFGRAFHNMDGEGDNSGSTLKQAFEESCNTAFIKLMDNASFGNSPAGFSAQADEARDVFGLGSWHIGVSSADPSVPPVTGGDPGQMRIQRAANAIGQGDVLASPLVMASIGATVAHGGFKQPVLGGFVPQQPAASPIRQSTASALRAMMRATAQSGTAAPRLAGMGASVGGKTGTAEVDGQAPNGWFVGYDGTLSVAAEVIGAKTGAGSAGYVVADILRKF